MTDLDRLIRGVQGEVQFETMRAILKAHKQSLTVGQREEVMGELRRLVGEAINKAYSAGWMDSRAQERRGDGHASVA